MNFLNTVLLGGSAAMLAPLLIHLLNRSSYRTLDWGAMHLLEAALQSNSRRLQWERWLLLLIRCLIPVLLALALARPVLTSFQLSGASENRSIALLLDDSLSMAVTNGTTSLFERAVTELKEIVAAAAPAEFALWTTSSPPLNRLDGSSLQTSIVEAALQKVERTEGTSATDAAIIAALRQLQTLSGSFKQLVVASDFQASQWRNVSDGQLQAIREQVQSGQSDTQIALLPILSATSSANVSVRSLENQRIDDRIQACLETPFHWTSQVINHGHEPINGLRLIFEVDGQELSARTMTLAPQASEQVDFACQFTQLGWHRLALKVADPSIVHGDDCCYAVVEVSPRPTIAIIDDSLTAEQIKTRQFVGTSRYLRLALAPLENPKENHFAIEVITSADLNRDALANWAAMIVTDVAMWNESLSRTLDDFVAGGGGLLIFEQQRNESPENGEQRRRWHERSPTMFGFSVGETHSVEPEQNSHLDTSRLGASAWFAWNAISDPLRTLEFTRWVKLTPNPQSTAARTLLSLNNGDPWLVEQETGPGIVLQCASSCDDEGSNMPRQPGYVPLMSSLAERITQHSLHRAQVMTGESLALHLVVAGKSKAVGQNEANEALRKMHTIEVQRIEVQRIEPNIDAGSDWFEGTSQWPVRDGRAVFTATRCPGVYAAQVHDGTEKNSRGDQPATKSSTADLIVTPALFSIASDRSESQLDSLSDVELKRLADRLGATIVSSASEYAGIQRIQRDGWEIWRWIVLVVLALLFVELLIGLRSTPSRVRGSL